MLEGVKDPGNESCKIIANEFMAVFEEAAKENRTGEIFLVARDTLPEDVIESVSVKRTLGHESRRIPMSVAFLNGCNSNSSNHYVFSLKMKHARSGERARKSRMKSSAAGIPFPGPGLALCAF